MSIKYAIRSKTPEDQLERRNKWEPVKNPFIFTDVPKEVAETHPDGVSAVFTNVGAQASSWISLNNYNANTVKEELTKVKPNPALPDFFGTELEVGDYVTSSFGESHSPVLCRVVGFTPKLVRIHNLEKNRIVGRDPRLLIKVPESLITRD